MKFFKKALVATAILGATNVAYAADLTDAITKTSVQGLELAAAPGNTAIRVIVREQLEAGDVITLVFGKGVTGTLSTATFGGASAGAGDVGISYGSGTYTMGNATFTANLDGTTTMTAEVLTGDPVTKDSSFEVSVTGTDISKTKTGEATVTYSAVSGLTGDAKDTTGDNVGLLIVTADQYGASVKTKANGVINRSPQTTFVSGGVSGNADADTIAVTITDAQNLLSAVGSANTEATVTIIGDFDLAAGATFPVAVTAAGQGTNTVTGGVATVAADKKSASFVVVDDAVDGLAGTYTLTIDTLATTADPIPATTFTASVVVDADDTDPLNTKQIALDKADAGEWEVDATIINVPYLPVGKEGTSSSIHFANETGAAVDVIVSAIDQNGTVYPAMDLGFDLAKQTVTKVSQTALMELFDIEAGSVTKLSVTFNIDADKGDVNGYAFTTDDTGRTEISTSQQRGN